MNSQKWELEGHRSASHGKAQTGRRTQLRGAGGSRKMSSQRREPTGWGGTCPGFQDGSLHGWMLRSTEASGQAIVRALSAEN